MLDPKHLACNPFLGLSVELVNGGMGIITAGNGRGSNGRWSVQERDGDRDEDLDMDMDSPGNQERGGSQIILEQLLGIRSEKRSKEDELRWFGRRMMERSAGRSPNGDIAHGKVQELREAMKKVTRTSEGSSIIPPPLPFQIGR